MRSGGGGCGRAAKCLEVCSENVRLPGCNAWFCHQPIVVQPTGRLFLTFNLRVISFFPWEFYCKKYMLGLAKLEAMVRMPDIPSHMWRSLSLMQSDSYISLF